MFMKTFEEKWTAWVDGELSDAERAEFEATLDDRAAAEAEKNQAHKLGALLKEQLQPRAMGNEEFFHHQLRGRIAAEMKEPAPRRAASRTGELVDDSSLALDRRVVARGLCPLHLFRHARETGTESIAILDADPERPR